MKNKNRILLTPWNQQLFFGLWENDRPSELAFFDLEDQPKQGDIYLGRVTDIVPGIQAAFVLLTPGQSAYLPLDQAPPNLHCGDELAVQITKEAQKTKDPVVSSHLTLPGKLVVLHTGMDRISVSVKITDEDWKESVKSFLTPLLASSCGFVVRTGAYQMPLSAVYEEAAHQIQRYKQICQAAATRSCYTRLWQSEPPWLARLYGLVGHAGQAFEILTDCLAYFEQVQTFLSGQNLMEQFSLRLYEDSSYSLNKLYRLETVISDALNRQVWLKSGGYLVIEPTEAMVVIDVNTGKAKGNKNKEETILKLNLEAAAEVAHQMRLRNLSGMILIDFIDMKHKSNQELLLDKLREAVRLDPVGVSVVDITKLGIVECTRRKIAAPLHEQISIRKTLV